MSRLGEFFNRKILGVKVLYIVGIFVLVLGFYAFRVYRAGDLDSDGEAITRDFTEDLDEALPASDYLVSDGTTYAPSTPEGDFDVETEQTNETWLAKAIPWLAANKGVSTLVAQSALQKYLSGADLTYQQGLLVDAAIKQFGTPPSLGSVGIVGAQTGGAQPTLRRGSKGSRVTALQKGLNDRLPALKESEFLDVSQGKPLKVSGVFDAQTEAWIKAFQKRSGLPTTGAVDSKTQSALALRGVKF